MIIAVDGPAAAGKGTLCHKLAKHFNLAMLDTGLIYRAVARKTLNKSHLLDTKCAIETAQHLSLNDLNVGGLRNEAIGSAASRIAAVPEIRSILVNFQRDFAKNPPDGKSGTILDGRDIGTIVCPDAPFKLFVTADPEVRAERRYKELQDRGEKAIRSAVLKDIIDRDIRDKTRTVSPLEPASDAQVLDTTGLDPHIVFSMALDFISSKKR